MSRVTGTSHAARTPPPKVLMIACAFPPTGASGVQRSVKFAKYLPMHGWTPIVWTVDQLNGLPRDPTLLDDLPEGLQIHASRAGTGVHRMRRLLGRMEKAPWPAPRIAKAIDWRVQRWQAEVPLPDDHASWARASVSPVLELIKREGIDAIYSTFPPPSNHLLALQLKERTGLPWIADFRDLWTDDLRYHESIARRRSAHRALEQQILESADAVVGVTPKQTEILSRHVPDKPGKFVTITNGFDPADFACPPPERIDTDRFVLGYVGRLDQYRARDEWCEGMRRFATQLAIPMDRFLLRIVGHASDATRAKLADMGIQVERTGYVPHAQAIACMRRADALLLLTEPTGPNADSVIPGKLFEYLASQRPILVVGPTGGQVERIVRETDAGPTVPYDPNAIASALSQLVAVWQAGDSAMRLPRRTSAHLQPQGTDRQSGATANQLDRRGQTCPCQFAGFAWSLPINVSFSAQEHDRTAPDPTRAPIPHIR